MRLEIAKIYEAAGWAIEIDQDINFLTFKAAGPAPKVDVVPAASVDQMLQSMKAAQGKPPGVRPPIVQQASRDDNPYVRTKLSGGS